MPRRPSHTPTRDEELLSGLELSKLPLPETKCLKPIDAAIEQACAVAAAMGRAGFAIISGGGPGLMEPANRGARDAGTR